MSEKPKRKPKDFGKASVDFVAPLSLADCVLRIRDMESPPTGYWKPGFEPSYERVERGIVRFKIKCTRYDKSWHREISLVALEGYLQKIDVTSTIVVAKTHISMIAKFEIVWASKTHVSMITPIIIAVLVGLMVLSGIVAPPKAGGFIFFIGGALMLLFYGLMLWSDRRSLVRLIHHAMSDDLQ